VNAAPEQPTAQPRAFNLNGAQPVSDTPQTDAIDWLLSLPLSPRRRWWHRDYSRGRLPDLAPIHGDPYGILRWPTGDIWIPTPTPPSGLFGTATRRDWQHHARAAADQARALARVVTLYDSHRADAQGLSQRPGPHQ